jgi:DNA-binding response OmpR family regulator
MKILVVEDEPTIAIGLQDDLEVEGYEVSVVSDGEAALRHALEKAYDLILLDVMLPGKDGFTVCREIRKAGKTMPVILLTARGQEVDRITGFGVGADDYVTKPFSPKELTLRIKAVLKRTSGYSQKGEDSYQFGDVEVDFTSCQVQKSGKLVGLTATELKLLRVFVENRGKVLSLDEIIQKVWGKDVFLSDRVVYTHVNNLRGKIEANPSKPRFVVSLRGLGYRFDG